MYRPTAAREFKQNYPFVPWRAVEFTYYLINDSESQLHFLPYFHLARVRGVLRSYSLRAIIIIIQVPTRPNVPPDSLACFFQGNFFFDLVDTKRSLIECHATKTLFSQLITSSFICNERHSQFLSSQSNSERATHYFQHNNGMPFPSSAFPSHSYGK